jgi:hypothetical protein
VTSYSPQAVLYLRVRNVAGRVLGIASALAGLGFLGWSAWLAHAAGSGFEAPEASGVTAGALFVTAIVCTLCGAVGLLARSFRPDLGDLGLFAPAAQRESVLHRGPRSWWTGDPLEPPADDGEAARPIARAGQRPAA